jgi:hypothetical protein
MISRQLYAEEEPEPALTVTRNPPPTEDDIGKMAQLQKRQETAKGTAILTYAFGVLK